MKTTFYQRLDKCLFEADEFTKIARKLADEGEKTETRRAFLGRGLGTAVAGSLNPVALAAPVAPAALATSHTIKNLFLKNQGLWSRLLEGDNGEIVYDDMRPKIPSNALVNMLRRFAGSDDEANPDFYEILNHRKTLFSSLTDSDLRTVIAQCGTEHDRQLLLDGIYHSALDNSDNTLGHLAKLGKGYGISGDDVLKLVVNRAKDVIYTGRHSPKSLQISMDLINKQVDQLSNKLEQVGLKPSITQNIKNHIQSVQKDVIQRIEQAERQEAMAREKKQHELDLIRWEGEGGALAKESKFAKRLNQLLETIR